MSDAGNGAREVLYEYFNNHYPLMSMAEIDHMLVWLGCEGYWIVPLEERARDTH